MGNNKFVLMQRPVFNISEKFAQTHGLQFTKYNVPGNVVVAYCLHQEACLDLFSCLIICLEPCCMLLVFFVLDLKKEYLLKLKVVLNCKWI